MNSLLLVVAGAVYVSSIIAITKLGTKLISRFVPSFREEVVYSLSLVGTAAQYVEWAQAGGTASDIAMETGVFVFFASLAVAGLQCPEAVAGGRFIHAGWDWILHPMPATAWVPTWFPDLCVGYDVLLALYIFSPAKNSVQSS
jgi:hypothetical protein